MAHRIVNDAADLNMLTAVFGSLKMPFTVTWTQGRDRTLEQNRMQRLWCREIAEQLGDRTAEDVRGYCKLHIGVPILRAEDEAFCEAYDRLVRPLPYADKLACMVEPIDFPVTRRMKVRQMVSYLDGIQREFAEQGIRLTDPDPDLAKYHARYRAEQRKAA